MSDIQKRNFYQKIGHLPDVDYCWHIQRLQEMHKRAQPPDGLMITSLPVPSIATPTQQNSALTLAQTPLTTLNALPSHTPNHMDGNDQVRSNPILGMSDVGQVRSNPVRSVAAQVQYLGQERHNTATPGTPPIHRDMILSENTPDWEQKYEERSTSTPITPATPRVKQKQQDTHTRDEEDDNSEQSSDTESKSKRVSNKSKTPLDRSKAAYETRSATRNHEKKSEKKPTVAPKDTGSREKYSPGRREDRSRQPLKKNEREPLKTNERKMRHSLPTPQGGGRGQTQRSFRRDPSDPSTGDDASTSADSKSDSSSTNSQRRSRGRRPRTRSESKRSEEERKSERETKNRSTQDDHEDPSSSDDTPQGSDKRKKRKRKKKKESKKGHKDHTSSSEGDSSSGSSDDSSSQDISDEHKRRNRNRTDTFTGHSRLTRRPMKDITGFRQTFSGSSGEDLLSFLSNFNRFFVLQGNKPGDENLGHLLALTLRGEAATTIAHMSGYQVMVDRLKEAYVAATAALVQILMHQKMYKDETVASWTQRYRAQYYKCTAAGHTFGPKDELNFWIKGLVPEYRTPIITQSHRSFARAINAATALETALKHTDDYPTPLNAYVDSGEVRINAQYGIDRGCYNCTQKGHFATECTNPPFCSHCNKGGHNYRDCTRKPEAKQSETSKSGSGKLVNVTCRLCQQEGHLAKNCTSKRANKGSKRNNRNHNSGGPKIVCNYCHRRGHIEADCRKKIFDLSKLTPKNGPSNSSDTCSECSGLLSKGHYATCSKSKAQGTPHTGARGSGLTYSLTLGSQGGQRQFLITLRISGEPFVAIVDPGAELSIVRRSVWKRFATPTLESRYKLISLCRMSLPVVGMTSLTLSFVEGSRELKFRALMTIVPDYIFYPGAHMLLGLDVLRPLRMNMDIDENRDVLILKDHDRSIFKIPLWQQKGIRDINTATAAAIHMIESTQGMRKARETVHEILARESDTLELPSVPDGYIGTCDQAAPLADLSPSFVPKFPWTTASDRSDDSDESTVDRCKVKSASNTKNSNDTTQHTDAKFSVDQSHTKNSNVTTPEINAKYSINKSDTKYSNDSRLDINTKYCVNKAKTQNSLTHNNLPIALGNTAPYTVTQFVTKNGISAWRANTKEPQVLSSLNVISPSPITRFKGKIVPDFVTKSNPFSMFGDKYAPDGKDERTDLAGEGESLITLATQPALSSSLQDLDSKSHLEESAKVNHSITSAPSQSPGTQYGVQDTPNLFSINHLFTPSSSPTQVPVVETAKDDAEASPLVPRTSEAQVRVSDSPHPLHDVKNSSVLGITRVELAQLWEARADPNRYPTFAATTTPTNGNGLLREL